ncbi:MAG: hypothetical protein JNM94_17275 [Phycisphaerae bacterium]|nr:hypothetical protein [Phycisphaerae bacterium]
MSRPLDGTPSSRPFPSSLQPPATPPLALPGFVPAAKPPLRDARNSLRMKPQKAGRAYGSPPRRGMRGQ